MLEITKQTGLPLKWWLIFWHKHRSLWDETFDDKPYLQVSPSNWFAKLFQRFIKIEVSYNIMQKKPNPGGPLYNFIIGHGSLSNDDLIKLEDKK